MKNNWEVKKLGELVHLKRGHNPPKSKFSLVYKEGYVRFYQIRDGWSDEYTVYVPDSPQLQRVNPDDILMVAYRHVGKAFRGVTGAFNVALCKITNARKDLLDDDYLFRIIPTSYVKGELLKRSERSLIPSMSVEHLKEIEIPLPPLAEQQRIVTILDDAFAAIDQAKENAEKNLQNARDLFDSSLQSVFANPSDGWNVRKLSDVCTLINGRAYSKPELLNSGKYPVLRVGNFFTNKNWYYSDLELDEDKYCDNGDLLYAWSASFGPRIWEGEKVIYHYHIWKVIPDETLITKEFLYLLLEWDTEKIKKAQGTGTTMMHVSKGSMEARRLPIPPIYDQKNIVKKLNLISAEVKKLENIYRQKINDLEELKKSILQKAFSGELTVKRQVSNVIEFPVRIPNISATDLQAGIVALAFQRHQEKGKVLTFGHVKAEKIVHLTQEVLNIELDREPVKDAAGPNDFPRLKRVESRAEKAGFFRTIKQGFGYSYIPGNQFDNLIEKTKTALNDKAVELTNLIDLLVPMDTQQAELVATIYAAWNNLLIDNQTITDEAIIFEARENWHEAKLNIPRERFFSTISWLKQKNLIPNGIGKKVKSRPNKS